MNTSGNRNKTTPCFLYILGICEAVQCKYKHEFMRCHSMCGYFNCKFFTLTPEELESVRENVRPFTEKVAKEVDRMAYIIVTSTPTRPDHICCRFLTGKFCNYPSQYACKICPHFQEKSKLYSNSKRGYSNHGKSRAAKIMFIKRQCGFSQQIQNKTYNNKRDHFSKTDNSLSLQHEPNTTAHIISSSGNNNNFRSECLPPDSDSNSSTISNESLHVSDNSLENNNDLSDNILITDTNPFSNEICEGKLDASPTNTFCNIFEKNDADVNARPSLLSDLITWFYDKKVNHEQLTGILQVLNKHGHPDLPSCSKTALKTVRKLPYIEVVSTKNTPAQFIYFGIKQNLEIEFKRGLSSILKESTIQLVCNVDGLSIFTSSVWQFWPLLGQIFVKNCHTEPFVIALYYGDSKPADLETYFQEFIEEINVLQTTGFTYEETNFKFQLKYFICDSPARAFLKCVKSHNGFFSCDKCNVKGHTSNDGKKSIITYNILAEENIEV
ncbi:unnamed protein product [Psylliodes chrysocephalus]|uniref:C3H1-type domain-containing protein n=1 Tax=Psylliodes chrysocephalus TaxID=3402493 RepID=A0A9P0D979_9CUCU|nr:unnamed protein product [Psylliodes chrysocephala]